MRAPTPEGEGRPYVRRRGNARIIRVVFFFFLYGRGFNISVQHCSGVGLFLLVFYRFALQHGTDKLGKPSTTTLKPRQNHQVFQINLNKCHCGLCLGQEICHWQAQLTEQQPWGSWLEPGAENRFCVQLRMLTYVWHPAPKLWAFAALHSWAAPHGCKPASLA